MKHIKSKIKAIIFDMDGTIIKSESVWGDAVRAVLTKRGYHALTKKQIAMLESFSGVGLAEAARQIKAEFNLPEQVDELVAEKRIIAKDLFRKRAPNFIDGFDLFHELLRNHAMPSAVATNADLQSLKNLDEQLKLSKYFGKHLYSIDHVGGRAKPDPSVFLHAAAQLGVKPEECIVFEDSHVGFLAAQAAGIRCIAVKNELNANLLHLTHHAIDNYHDALEALRDLAGDHEDATLPALKPELSK